MKTNEQMTTKEKAIESLKEVSGIVSHPEHNTLIADIAHELSQPTLDDAINVVEEMKNNPNNNFMTMKQVLIALKGLNGGIEK